MNLRARRERPRRTGAGGGDAVAGTRRRQVPRGATWDPATRTLTLHARTRARRRDAALRARVAPAATLGTQIEVVGYATGPDDPLPLDDRGVFRAV